MKSIFINSSPNTLPEDVFLAFGELLRPWRWRKTSLVKEFESDIERFFEGKVNAVAFDSARSSFFNILKAWDIKEGDEVIVPAFTCTVIVNPVLWTKATPVYVDIDPITLNMDMEDLESKITDNTKVILAQHTFGLPMDMKKLRKIADKNNIKIVEDCAHSLGVTYEGSLTGTWGDAAVITFGITKVISGVRGGMALVKSNDLKKNLIKNRDTLPAFPWFKAFKFIINPIIWFIIQPIYYVGIAKLTLGRVIAYILQKLRIISISNIVENCEEMGIKPDWIPAKMSGSMAKMAQLQFKKLKTLNVHRKKLSRIYSKNLYTPYFEKSLNLRYPLYVKDRHLTMDAFKKKGIILGDWYRSILHIPKKYYSRLKYTEGSCPNAEYAAKELVNLPTFIKVTEQDAKYISEFAKEYIDTRFYKKKYYDKAEAY